MGNWRVEKAIELYPVKDINSAHATWSLRVSSEYIFQTMYQVHRRKLNPHEDVGCIQKIIDETNLDIVVVDTQSAIYALYPPLRNTILEE